MPFSSVKKIITAIKNKDISATELTREYFTRIKKMATRSIVLLHLLKTAQLMQQEKLMMRYQRINFDHYQGYR